MRRSEDTRMGGDQSKFQTTRWTDIRRLRNLEGIRQRAALNQLVGRYWKPVYCYLRRKGHDNETAKDLTQGFFYEIVLGKRLPQQAREEKGRFRTFLLTALDRYVSNMYRYASTQRRRPHGGFISLDAFEEEPLVGPVETMQPEDAFSYVWASLLVQQAVEKTREQCLEDGLSVHWNLFEARILKPIFTDEDVASLKELCVQCGVAEPVRAENMIVTVRRRFKKNVKQIVREHVESDAEAEEELRDLLSLLQK